MRNQQLDSVRLVCNLMVVIFHAYPFMYFTSYHFDWYVMRLVIYYFGNIFLPTLFLLSGWLYFRNFKMEMYGAKLRARIKRLFVPYVAWNGILLAVYYGMGLLSERSRVRFENFHLEGVWDYLMAILPITSLNPDAPTWFIRTLLIFAVFSPIAYAVFRFCSSRVALAVILLPLIWVLWSQTTTVGGIKPYAISCFCLGGLMAYRGMDLCDTVQKYRKVVVVVGVCAVLTAFILGTWCNVRTDDCSYGIRDVELFLASPLLIAFGAQIDKVVRKMPFRADLMASSFFVYCGHVFVVSCCVHGLGSKGFNPWLIMIIAAPLSLVIMVLWWKVWRMLSPRTVQVVDGTL